MLPLDRPFHRGEAVGLGVTDHVLAVLVEAGWLRRPVVGVYHRVELDDDLELRIACLRLVVPEDAVITDRTAAWLWGVSMILGATDHLATPRVSVFRPRGYRLRNRLVASGSRDLRANDIAVIGGLRVTTPMRTACDLGRLLPRDQAIAALDALARDQGVDAAALMSETGRFRGFRGVRQLRTLAALVDGRSRSPGESVLRIRWLDCDILPRPIPQLEVPGPVGSLFLDLGVWRPRFAAEYDGEAWHGEDRAEHDRARRTWLTRELGFTVTVLRKADLFGPQQRAEQILREGFAQAQQLARRPAYWINEHTA